MMGAKVAAAVVLLPKVRMKPSPCFFMSSCLLFITLYVDIRKAPAPAHKANVIAKTPLEFAASGGKITEGVGQRVSRSISAAQGQNAEQFNSNIGDASTERLVNKARKQTKKDMAAAAAVAAAKASVAASTADNDEDSS